MCRLHKAATSQCARPSRADHTSLPLQLRSIPALHLACEFRGEGVWHIWIGLDHVLFLLTLLLPSVLVRDGSRWRAVARFRQAFAQVAKVVTAFTVAHSLTLSLAVLGVVAPPSRLVESLLALSVMIAAANN